MKPAKMKDNQQERKGRNPFVLLETLEMLTQQDTEHLFPTLDGEWYQKYLETTMGA